MLGGRGGHEGEAGVLGGRGAGVAMRVSVVKWMRMLGTAAPGTVPCQCTTPQCTTPAAKYHLFWVIFWSLRQVIHEVIHEVIT